MDKTFINKYNIIFHLKIKYDYYYYYYATTLFRDPTTVTYTTPTATVAVDYRSREARSRGDNCEL